MRALARAASMDGRGDTVRGERAPFPSGVGVREDGDSRALRCTYWHVEDARKRFRGMAQPRLNKRLTAHHREPNWPRWKAGRTRGSPFATSRSPVPSSESSAAGPPPNVFAGAKLSVIVPFYNVQQYAPDTLRSLRRTRERDFEFILVDDCSTDGTPDLLERAAEDLPDVARCVHPPRAERRARHRAQHRHRRGAGRVPDVPGRRRLAGPRLPHRTGGRHRGVGLRLRAHRPCAGHRAGPYRPPGAARPALGGDQPAGRDPARPPLDLGGLRLRLGGHLPPPAGRPGRCCTSPTGCARPRTGRGSGSCTGRRSPSPR